jgi:hypothetical protein
MGEIFPCEIQTSDVAFLKCILQSTSTSLGNETLLRSDASFHVSSLFVTTYYNDVINTVK